MVKRFNQHIKATNQLDEGTLFSTPAEKVDILKDKNRVANAFLYNFFGMLGMINATQPAQRQTILNFLKKDKQLRVDSIDETNLDISQSVKLAHEAGFFVNPNIVNEITRFLVKLKMGQINQIDSLIVGKWANSLKPEFLNHLSDPAMRRVFIQFRNDEGKTIDVSRFAVALKARVNKIPDGGDFQRYSKRFFGLTEIKPGQVAAAPVAQPAAATPAQPAAPAKLSYYQKQKLKKQQAAAGTTPAPAPTTAAAPTKLSYYQRQKLKKQQAAQPAIDAAKAAAAAAQAAAALKAKEEEENRKAQAAAVKKMPKEHLDQMMKDLFRNGAYPSSVLYQDLTGVKRMFGFDIVPDVYAQVANNLNSVSSNMNAMTSSSDSQTLNQAGERVRAAFREISKLTGHNIDFVDIVSYVTNLNSSSARGHYGGRYTAVLLLTGEPITPDLYEKIVYQLNTEGIRKLCSTLQGKTAIFKKLGEIAASKDSYLKKMCEEGYPIHASLRLSKQYNQPKSYTFVYGTYSGYEELAYQVLTAYNKPFHQVIDYLLGSVASNTSSALWFDDAFVAFGMNMGDTVVRDMQDNLASALRIKFTEFYDDSFTEGKYSNVIRRMFRNPLANSTYSYNASIRRGGGPLLQQLHEMFAKDLIDNGWSKSKVQKVTGATFNEYYVKFIFSVIGVSGDDMIKNHPNDPASVYIKVIKDGLNSVDTDKLTQLILADPASNNTDSIFRIARNLQNSAQGDRDTNVNAVSKAVLKIAQAQPDMFNNATAGTELLRQLPYADADTVNGWLRLAKENKNNWIMAADLYKYMPKSDKQDYVDILTGIVQDSIGSDVEDYVNDIVDSLPPHVVQKMRSNLVGGAVLIDEIVKGEIKPFDKVDSARLKKIFLYNDIDMSALLTGVVDKKKKSETYVQYFARAKQSMKDKKMLQQAKVKEDNQANAKAINKIMIERDHAGKHGDTYPMIDKVYDANLEYPEFFEFRKNKPRDGSIAPAYHGTGGIAAGMILRYGFKVIKSSDPSVVGRMLGDGIYFSNKIDKVSQYVSNGGYSRQHGQKGYVMEMDTNLGTRNTDYRAAGVDGRDSIRSPEWCVVDPKAQLRITRVYEVTLVSKRTVDQHLKEGVEYTGLRGFKQHLKEQVVQENGNVTSFVFRNGMIPIVDLETAAVDYVDFEEALSKKLIKEDMFDTSAQGPVIVFRGTADQVVIDERFAEHMGGDDLQLYIQLFREEMSRT